MHRTRSSGNDVGHHVTETGNAGRDPSGCIAQWASNIASSCTTSLGAVTLPSTLAEGRSSMRWVAVISPLTLPATTIDAALILAVTTAFSPIVTLSVAVISPSNRPSIRAGPWKL